jgi:hypothetical protein
MGLAVVALERDQTLQDLVLSVFHATMHVFSASQQPAKIVENHLGRAFVKSQQMIQVPQILQLQPTSPAPPTPPPE